MYIPRHFQETDLDRVRSLVKAYGFATIVTSTEGGPIATHLPLMVEGDKDWVIVGHMAKANNQWKHFQEESDVLIIFQGPHTYISPSNYETASVPTWNYAAVHLYGKAEIIVDASEVRRVVDNLSHKYEKDQDEPWKPEYPDRMLGAIVAFRIPVGRIEAKSKLSQNKTESERATIISSLATSGNDDAMGVSKLMQDK